MRVREMVVDGVVINDESDSYVIAEIGQNHEGDIDKCMALFDAAKQCGASAVKLQKRDNRSLYTRRMYDEPYNSENAYAPTYGEHREHLEFDRRQYAELLAYARKIGITMFATAWDIPSADLLDDIGIPAFKIASGDLKSIPLLRHIARFGKPMFISTGGSTMTDVKRMYEAVAPINPAICIMQCTSGYPPAFAELNIRVIDTYRRAFPDTVIGFSSHDNGIAMALLGYMLGARAVEKHFTLNRSWKGADQAFSLEPSGMRRLVRDLKRARIALGDGVKRFYPSEIAPMRKMGKMLVAARRIGAGETLTENDIACKSPGEGIAPCYFDFFVGQTLKQPLGPDEPFTFAAIGASEADARERADTRRRAAAA